MKTWTQLQIRKWVLSGAMHPMALVRERIIERRRTHEVWLDEQVFPWNPGARTLTDLVALVCQENLRGGSENTYWRLCDQVFQAVFGVTHEQIRKAHENRPQV